MLGKFATVITAITIIAVIGLFTVSALADENTADEKTMAHCGVVFDQCENACKTNHTDDAAKRAPCMAKCSGLHAVCNTDITYDKAKPWIAEQLKRAKRFFDLLNDRLDNKASPEVPKKDRNNSL